MENTKNETGFKISDKLASQIDTLRAMIRTSATFDTLSDWDDNSPDFMLQYGDRVTNGIVKEFQTQLIEYIKNW